MTVAKGVKVQLVASEPLVRQPVCIEFDDRGRLWVIQYLQYPNPAGLQRVDVDRYSRTEYDRIPKPPPHGPRGTDRITILSDTNHDGQMDSGFDFVNGLNLASGLAFGHGGVFVLNVPYLLFYPDQDRNDVPDADPRVLLTGFGMQDAHSVANSLTWGPDGWLYGCQGSTVTARIRGHEFQQGVWRYHVQTDRFELFCEGGGNSWGLDFDHRGNLYYSTNYGGYVLVHGVQGGYYVKSFVKHGALHNPYTYGYFNHAPHTGSTGGHVTVGGFVYQGGSLPDFVNGKYIGGDLLGHAVYWHDLNPVGSTVATAHNEVLLKANDSWFAPADLTTGPDGAVYIADWHDQRTAHPDPDADWDRSNGRIYRIAAVDTPPAESIDYGLLSTAELLQRHQSPNQWHVRRARQELVRQNDSTATELLREMLYSSASEKTGLEALWSLAATGAFEHALAFELLDSPYPAVRSWTLRLLGDSGNISKKMAHRLDELAEEEPHVRVRQQLACTARRLSAKYAVPIINANIIRDIDNNDPYLPLLWWWAVEQHSMTGRDEVIRRFVRPTAWQSNLGRGFLLPRLIRRYAAAGSTEGLDAAAALLKSAPSPEVRGPLWQSVFLGLQQRDRSPEDDAVLRVHPLSLRAIARWEERPTDIVLHRIAIRLLHAQAIDRALEELVQSTTASARQIELLEALRVSPSGALVDPLLSIIGSPRDEAVQAAALQTLSGVHSVSFAGRLVGIYGLTTSDGLKSQIRGVLLGRPESARIWLEVVDRGDIPASDTPIEQIRTVALLDDPALNRLVLKHWGRLEASSREERLAEVRRLNNDVRAASGNPIEGRALFKKHCAACHQLFGEGKKIGPDLTTANRSDRQALLISLVDPSSVIRREYTTIVVQTTDGRVLSGLPVSQDDSGITLVNNTGKAVTIASSNIEQTKDSAVSLMPEDLYRQMTPQQLRDLFAWLQSSGPEQP
ncbi:MAG: c-type cytochrome [Fuerstiella sp.]|nr:c-type cytochrome [Fuerstiella sp.]